MMDWNEDASSKDDVLNKHKFDNWSLSNPDGGAFKELLDVEAEDEKVSDGQLAVDQGSIAKKVNWPELAQDASPSSLLHPCMKCIQRHEKKIDLLLQRFTNVEPTTLTPLQEQTTPQLKTKLNKVREDLTASVDSIEARIKDGTLNGFTRGPLFSMVSTISVARFEVYLSGLTWCSRQLRMNKQIKVMLEENRQMSFTRVLFLEDVG
eukprot:s1132_g11.t1